MAMYHAISSNANVLIRTYGPHCRWLAIPAGY